MMKRWKPQTLGAAPSFAVMGRKKNRFPFLAFWVVVKLCRKESRSSLKSWISWKIVAYHVFTDEYRPKLSRRYWHHYLKVCEILEEVDTKIMKFDPKLCISNCMLLGWKSHLNFKKHLDSWVFHDSKCNHRQYKKQFKLGTWNASCILLGDVKVVKEGDDPRADVRAKTQMFWIEFDYIDR